MAKRYLYKRVLVRLLRQVAPESAAGRWLGDRLFRHDGNHARLEGARNRVTYHGASLHDVTIEVAGDDNEVTIAPGAMLARVQIRVTGRGHRLAIGEGCVLGDLRLVFEDADCRITVGPRTTIEGGHISAVEPGHSVTIGSDCMLSHDIDIRTSDSHAILDATSGERLNPAADIAIADHVWIGAYARVLKGVTIGRDSVVGMNAIVTADVGAGAIAVGTPARVVRTGVTWTRER